jgi:hypothetical protein
MRPKMRSTNKTFFSLIYPYAIPDLDDDVPRVLPSADPEFFESHIGFYIPLPQGTILRVTDGMMKNIEQYAGCFLFFIQSYSTDGEEPLYSLMRTNGRIFEEHQHEARRIHVLLIDHHLSVCSIDEAAKMVLSV